MSHPDLLLPKQAQQILDSLDREIAAVGAGLLEGQWTTLEAARGLLSERRALLRARNLVVQALDAQGHEAKAPRPGR